VKKILVVDDEPTLVATLKYNLEREQYQVITAADGAEALEAARSQQPDLILLDLMLPGLGGLEVCRILRKDSSVPILMLTAKDAEVDKVVGLELGADDYVTKPFGMRELMARVRALLRRAEASAAGEPRDVVESGDLTADLGARRVYKGGAELRLKPKEYDLLVFFLQNKGRAFTREEILSRIWGYSFAGDTRTVDVHIRWLRQKVEADPANPSRLVTVRGTGYRFEG
jgi:DNA-binding response OmpR family regulator